MLAAAVLAIILGAIMLMSPARRGVGGLLVAAGPQQGPRTATGRDRQRDAAPELVRSEVEAVARAFRGEIAEAESRLARSLDALTESFTQARREVASLAQQARRTEAAVGQLVETQAGDVTPAPAPAPVRPSLLDDLDRQLREAETRLARRRSTGDR